MLYWRFIICLTMGLTGLCMVLKTVLDSVLADWNILDDLRYLFAGPFLHKHSYIEYTHSGETQKFSTRMR